MFESHWFSWSQDTRHPKRLISVCLGFVPGLSQPFRIDVFEDYIYGVGMKHDVFRVHKYGMLPAERLMLGVERASSILVFHRYKQQEGQSQSYVSNAPDLYNLKVLYLKATVKKTIQEEIY